MRTPGTVNGPRAVHAGIVDVLEVGAKRQPTPHMRGVEGLDNRLAAIIQLAIAQQEAQSAIGEILLVRL